MLLALDVGNTNIVIGFLGESGIRNIARLETDRDKTAHEYAISLRQVIEFSGIAPENIDGSILSSVVPPINGALIAAVRMIAGIRPLVVGPGMKTGLNIALDNPATMGSDLVVGAAAALAIHDPPLIIIDMGTATTMTVIDREARVLGGAIIPGVGISLEALANGTSQLPHISLDAPKKCISTDTVEAMRSGSVCPAATGSAAASDVQLSPAPMRTCVCPPKVTVRSVAGSMPRASSAPMAMVQAATCSGSTPKMFESVRRTCVPPAVSCTAVRADTSVTATPSRSSTPDSDRLASMGLVLHALTQRAAVLESSMAKPPKT